MDTTIISQIGNETINLVHNPKILLLGVILIGITILIMYLLKNFIANSIVGVIGLFICSIIGIKLPFMFTLIITSIFGLAGLGFSLILKFFGIL